MRRSFFLAMFLLAPVAHSQMIRNDAIGNDPEREKLCIARSHARLTEPFEMDTRYLSASRRDNPGATFIVADGYLVECEVSDGTGKFGPSVTSPEQWYWHLIRPPQFKPGLGTNEGKEMAANACKRIVPATINKPNFDHIGMWDVTEINVDRPKDRPGALIAGVKAVRYDIVVRGTALYKTSGLDLADIQFTCLLSPMLDLKGIQTK